MVGVVIPLSNEENTVEDLLGKILNHLEDSDRVYCVLDRSCRDSTLERVRKMSEADPKVVLVWAPETRCVVDAYFRGYREALGDNCGWILEMDGGFSHCPEEIPRFFEVMSKGVDFAAGSRFAPGGSYSGRWSRHLISRGGTAIANLLLRTRMRDMTSGFECFTRRSLAHVVSRGVRSRAHFFQTEIRFMLHEWDWVEVPISYSSPSKSVGGNNVLEAFRILWQMFRENRRPGAQARP